MDSTERRRAGTRASPAARVPWSRRGWGARSLAAFAGLAALFLGLPVAVLVGAGGPRRFAGPRPDGAGRPRGPGPEPHDDGGQPRPHGRLRPAPRLRPGPAAVPGLRTGRGDRRPAAGPAAVRGRPRSAARAGPARPPRRAARGRRDRDPLHDLRRHPGPDVRLGAVLRPVGANRDRERRARLRGRRAGRRRLGDRPSSATSPSPWPAAPSRPAS